MDQLDDSKDAYLPIQTQYPDLDFVPRYPWLGEAQSESRARDTGQQIHEAYAFTYDGSIPRLMHDSEPEFRDDSNNPSVHATTHYDNTSIDPDYHFQEDSSLSDELLSEAESDFQSLDNPLDATRGGQRGRPRGRSRGGRGRVGQGFRGGRGGKGIKRGLRKPLEPSQEFKMLHSQATMAFIDHDYALAEDFVQQAIAINPEMFSAHTLLSEIYMARGDQNKALTALFHGVHTRPRDTQAWCKVAELILERAGDDRSSAVRDAIYCYNRVIGANPAHVEARYRRAALNREIGNEGRAAYEYERLLKQLPHDTTVLRHLAEIYIDLDEVERAVRHYEDSISHYQSIEPYEVASFTWSDVNIYAELFSYLGQFNKGISMLKSLSRWLLGRRKDDIWDNFEDDDREFDADDLPRRTVVQKFTSGKYEPSAYGKGLPLELRVKLGVFRLQLGADHVEEAMGHFGWLDPENNRFETRLFDYPDLFREVGDALHLHNHHSQALRFYQPLQQIDEYVDVSYLTNMASCYREQGLTSEAEDCYKTILDIDASNVEARIQLANRYEDLGMPERASMYINDALSIGTQEQDLQNTVEASVQIASIAVTKLSATGAISKVLAPRSTRQTAGKSLSDKEACEKAQDERFQIMFVQMRGLKVQLRAGNENAKVDWMRTAKVLIADFRNNRVFFPFDKYMKFYGYTKEARAKSSRSKASQVMEDKRMMAQHIQMSSGDFATTVPTTYRGIAFHDWLDILLEYAVLLACAGRSGPAYEIVSVASDANIFYHSTESMFLIHVSWFTCALISNDQETLCNVSRYFMKEYQFITDSYRLYSSLNRLCDDLTSCYNSGPSQKFILRQVKAMDFSFMGENRRKRLYQERASYTTKDELGNPLQAQDLDVGLIMLYGHILYAGTSYSYALNYFFRAYAVDPMNPMINLSLALGYIHYALKRQSENRHYHITQGFAFLFAYYEIRQNSNIPSERQEGEFNVGRAYHMLGLVHLAIPYYERCLALSGVINRAGIQGTLEDFASDAAFALQGIWAASGQRELARAVTEEWLTL